METIKCKNNYGKFVKIEKEKFFFRPSVFAVIVDLGKVLLMTSKSAGKYWLPGGGVEIGEKLEDALKREVREETGLKVKVNKLLLSKENFFYYEPLDEAFHAFLFFYECEPLSKKLISDGDVDDLESEKPRWYKISTLKKGDFCDLNDDIYKLIQKYKH